MLECNLLKRTFSFQWITPFTLFFCFLIIALLFWQVPVAEAKKEPLVPIGDGMIFDPNTGLTWEDGSNKNTYTWEDALAYTYDLEPNCTNWRVPTVKELGTIIDHTLSDPAADPVFDIESAIYWTSTPSNKPGAVYAIDFTTGQKDKKTDPLESHYVVSVMGGCTMPVTPAPTPGEPGPTVTSNVSVHNDIWLLFSGMIGVFYLLRRKKGVSS